MNKKEERKNNILIGAFKLFLSKEYADVVTADLEEITGVTRGAIYYKVKNKEGLYRAVIDKFVFEFLSNSIGREISVSKETPFLDFLKNELDFVASRMINLKEEFDDEKLSAKYIHLFSSACIHYKGFQEKYKEIEDRIIDNWMKYYDLGVVAGEIKEEIPKDVLIRMFRSLYYGDSYLLSIIGEGLNINDLEQKFLLIYQAIKK